MADTNSGFQKLVAWQRADDLASAVYHLARQVRKQDRWLASQMSRAAVSVPANIAEGYGRGSLGDYLRFIDISRGSLSEIEYYLHFLRKEGLVNEADLNQTMSLRAETGRLLHGLWNSLKAKEPSGWDHGHRRVRDEAGPYWYEVRYADQVTES